MLDVRKQPMLFPLDYTMADVEDVRSPGSYLLDVVDKSGEPLGVTVAASIGMLRNAESIEPDNSSNNDDGTATMPTVVPTSLPNTTSDVRLVLEASVRAKQMAFIHNQRTLEIGRRMAETLRDSVQVLATSQADWIKSISSARGLFRNAGQPLAPVEVKQWTLIASLAALPARSNELRERPQAPHRDRGQRWQGDAADVQYAATWPIWIPRLPRRSRRSSRATASSLRTWSDGSVTARSPRTSCRTPSCAASTRSGTSTSR